MTIVLADATELEIFDFNQSQLVFEDTLENIVNNVYPNITNENLEHFTISDAVDIEYYYYQTDGSMQISKSQTEEKVLATFSVHKLDDTVIMLKEINNAIAELASIITSDEEEE